jgi:hypothetical protein
VLIAPTIDARARIFSRQLARLLLDATREPLSLMPIAVSDYLRAGLKRGTRTLRYAIADCIEEKLPHIHAPVLVVRGGRDPIVPQDWAAEVARLSAGGRFEVLPHAAHAVNYNSPEELARLIIEFVNEKPQPNADDFAARSAPFARVALFAALSNVGFNFVFGELLKSRGIFAHPHVIEKIYEVEFCEGESCGGSISSNSSNSSFS